LQLWHGPSQALSQQTPLAQKPLAHSAFTEQGMTSEWRKHDPFTQGSPPSHCASLSQVLKQFPVAGLHAKGEQYIPGPVTHAPMPLQTEAGVRTPSEHDPAAQVVPREYRSQPPVPSHRPVCPQVEAMSLRQMPLGSGVPVATGVQVPTLRTRLQLTHGPSQALVQQTPSTQKPLAQSSLLVRPSKDRMKHDPFVQGRPPSHCASLVQEFKHLPDIGSQR
jgi:hypothetical protein